MSKPILSSPLLWRIWCSAALFLAIGNQISLGQSAATPDTSGIHVGRAKVFDNRTLTLMLEDLSEDLRRKQFVDQASLVAALGTFQGSSAKEFTSSTTVSTPSLPGVIEDVTTGTTAGSKTTTTKPAVTAQAPALDNLPAVSAPSLKFGEQSGDLLNDQVNLTYQIFNLRMLLERALTDRVLPTGEPRLLAVLGFNVSVEPEQIHRDAAAVVEVTVSPGAGMADTGTGVSLVALMPQEKTYNATALSSKSNSFGGAAVAKVVQVGYSQRSREQTFFLYADTDTVAFENAVPQGGDSKAVTFNWMFRPVLGRRSVSPERRQLFAIVSLPSDDAYQADEQLGLYKKAPSKNERLERARRIVTNLNIQVRTYWKRYDANSHTTFSPATANRRTKFLYVASLTLAKPSYFDLPPTPTDTYNLQVFPTADYQQFLSPRVQQVSWATVGSKSALISVSGENFFSGTKAILGDKVYGASANDGLVIKSNQTLELSVPLEALVSGSAVISGRYGASVDLTGLSPGVGASQKFEITNSMLGPALSGYRSLELRLQSSDKNSQALGLSDLPEGSPIVMLNGHALPPPYAISEDGSGASKRILVRTSVRDSYVGTEGINIVLSWPFKPGWYATDRGYDPSTVYQITRLTAGTIVLTTKDPMGFTIDPTTGKTLTVPWKIIMGSAAMALNTPAFAAGAPETTSLSDHAVQISLKGTDVIPDRVLLISPQSAVFSLDVPKLKPESTTLTVNQFDSVWLSIPVKSGADIDHVEIDGTILKHNVGTSTTSISVYIPSTLTERARALDFSTVAKDGTLTPIHVQVLPTMLNQK